MALPDGEDVDVCACDHVGCAPLHIVLLIGTVATAAKLVRRGVRILARLVDGRTPLHLAMQAGLPGIVRLLLEKSAENKAAEERKAAADSETCDMWQ